MYLFSIDSHVLVVYAGYFIVGGRRSPKIINMNRDVFQVTGINSFEKKLITIWSNFFEMYSSLNINLNHQWTPNSQRAIGNNCKQIHNVQEVCLWSLNSSKRLVSGKRVPSTNC